MFSWPIFAFLIFAVVLSWYLTRRYYLRDSESQLLNLKLGISERNTEKILSMLRSELKLQNGELTVEKIYDAFPPNDKNLTIALIEIRVKEEDQLLASFFEVFIEYSDIISPEYTLKEGDGKATYSDNRVSKLLSHANVIVELWSCGVAPEAEPEITRLAILQKSR